MATPIPENRAPLTAWGAAAATGGTIARLRDPSAIAIGITSDTRAIASGNAFVALRGEQADGHDFVSRAVARGATLLIVERGRPVPPDVDVVEVDDTLVAWGALARAHVRAWRRGHRGEDRPRVIAITGSAGKTTTKELCAAILTAHARAASGSGACHATAGNLNNRVGLPAVCFGIEADHGAAVLELGMSTRGEIAALAAICEPDVGVVTNIGAAHGEGVGGIGGVAHEKGALFEALGPSACAIANADDPAVMAQLARTRAPARTFGRAASADVRLVERTSQGSRGSRVVIDRASGLAGQGAFGHRIELDLPLVGEAAAIDLVAALAAAEVIAKTIAAPLVQQALDGVRPVLGRARVRPLGDGVLLVDDTYNANPASMRAAFATLAELGAPTGRRTIAILGEMRELGSSSSSEHRDLGDALARAGVALVIGCGGAIDAALERAAELGVTVRKTASTEAAATAAVDDVAPGDVVLVKGSRGVATERIVEALVRAHGEAAEGDGAP